MRYVYLSLLCLFIYSCGYSLVSNNPSALSLIERNGAAAGVEVRQEEANQTKITTT